MIKIVLFILFILVVIVFLAAYYLFRIAFVNTTNRSSAMEADHNHIPAAEEALEKASAEKKAAWLKNVQAEKIQLKSHDGLNLVAFEYLTPQPSHRWAILVHGFDSRHEEMFDKAPFFQELGFNLVLPDARAHGESEGKYIGFGWPERQDLQQWIGFILAKDPAAQIILYGVSMGGATVMMTAGEVLPENVVAVIEDCGYSSVAEELSYQLKQLFKLPAFPLIPAVSLINYLHQGWWLKNASSVKQLQKTKLPVLFIHGTVDTFVPYSMLAENYQATPTAKEQLSVAGAQHAMAGILAGEVYWSTIKKFLATHTALKGFS